MDESACPRCATSLSYHSVSWRRGRSVPLLLYSCFADRRRSLLARGRGPARRSVASDEGFTATLSAPKMPPKCTEWRGKSSGSVWSGIPLLSGAGTLPNLVYCLLWCRQSDIIFDKLCHGVIRSKEDACRRLLQHIYLREADVKIKIFLSLFERKLRSRVQFPPGVPNTFLSYLIRWQYFR